MMRHVSRRPRVFISYAREDAPNARRIYDDLAAAGADPWLDKESLLPGEPWKGAIARAIESSDFVVTLLSAHAVSKTGYVQKEIRLAIDVLDQHPESEVFLIPVRLEACEPTHERLRDLTWLDLFPDWQEGFSRILAVLRRAGYDRDAAQLSEIETKTMHSIARIAIKQPRIALKEEANWEGSLRQIITDENLLKQLPRVRLREYLMLLPPGEYRLAIARRRPRNRRNRDVLLQMFGRSAWKTNMWRIFPAEEFRRWIPAFRSADAIEAVASFAFVVADTDTPQ